MQRDEPWRPLNIMLSMYGSQMNSKLLFKYPFENAQNVTQPLSQYQQLTSSTFHLNKPIKSSVSNDEETKPVLRTEVDQFNSFSDDILGNILSPGNTKICGQKFDVKINGIRFVGFPLVLNDHSKFSAIKLQFLQDIEKNDNNGSDTSKSVKTATKNTTILSFIVVFALKAVAEYSIVEKYQDLCLRLGLAFRLEEKWKRYLSNEVRLMINAHENFLESDDQSAENPYKTILIKSKLAKHMKEIYHCICETGVISTKINNSILINFCLPHKVHNRYLDQTKIYVKVSSIEAKLKNIRPYHSILIYNYNIKDLWTSLGLPNDYVPSMRRLLSVYEPTKSLQKLSTDADLPLKHVYQIASQLVYWGKACVIYPLCDTNMYVLSPTANLQVNSELSHAFYKKFGFVLPCILSQFSLPLKLGDFKIPNSSYFSQEGKFVQVVFWLLQHRFLMQLHTYLFFLPPAKPKNLGLAYNHRKHYQDVTNSIPQANIELLKTTLTEKQTEAILMLPAALNILDLRQFLNLLKYFDGKHHVEEIMYNENLSRTEIRIILDKFKPVLLTCTREDPTTTAIDLE